MSLQEGKPKNRISQELETQVVSEEVKVKRMAYKSPVSRNSAPTEPKIMFKKMRSLKLHKVYSLKRRGTLQLESHSTNSSSNDSSSNQSAADRQNFPDGIKDFQVESESEEDLYSSSSSELTASTPLFLNQNGGTNAEKERNKVSKSKKHTCPGCFRPFEEDTKPRLTNPLQGSLVEGSHASPDNLKYSNQSAGSKKQVQAPSTTGLQVSQSKPAASSKKALKTLTKSSSKRYLRNKTSFKIKSSSAGNLPKIKQDLGLNRATCSSTLKDSKFTKQVELESGRNESDIFSAKKVCSYHHCSLHGHTHAPDPPPKPFLFRRRTERTPKSMETKGLSPDAVTSSRDKKKKLRTGKRFPDKESASAKANCGIGSSPVNDHKTSDFIVRTITKPRIEFHTGEHQGKEKETVARNLHSLHSGESENENFKLIQNSPALEQKIRVVPNELKETSDCCSSETKQERCTSESTDTLLKGEEVCDSNAGSDIITATVTDNPSTLSQESTSEDSAEATEDSTGVFSTRCYTSEEHSASREEKTGTSYPEVEPNKGSILLRDCEAIEDSNVTLAIDEVNKVHIQKNDHISMWHMIHQHMVLGLAEDAKNQQHHPRYRDGRSNDEKSLQETNDPHLSPDIATSEMDVKNHNQESKILELRKVFAIKLVREAIEKILLPEVEDQTSDMMSITSEAISDEEHPEKTTGGGEDQSITTSNEFVKNNCRETENNEVVEDKSFDAGTLSHTEVTISVPEDERTRKKSGKKTLKGWSNLRKIILLKRFVKELEKVKKFNPVQPHHLASEPESEAENISLRRQTMGEKKSTEEWMLDYALRQVVSELAPTQKRKVALLVKAFETVVPPHDDQNIQVTTPNLRIPIELKEKGIQGNVHLNSDLHSGGPEFTCAELDTSRILVTKPSLMVYSSATENKKDQNRAELVIPTFGSEPQKKPTAGKEETNEESRLNGVVHQELPSLIASNTASITNKEHKTQLDEQNIRMWHMIYRHVVSGIAEKIGTEILDVDGEGEEEEEVDDCNKFLDANTSGMKTDHHGSKENHDTNHRKIEFSRSVAVKLVQEAVDEILLPDIQDGSSDSQSFASDILPDHELIDKQQGDDEEPHILNSTAPAENSFKDSANNIKESTVSVDQEKKASPIDDINSQNFATASSIIKNNLVQQKSRNWSKLKKLILLKRSIKALEVVRKLNPKPLQQLPLTSDTEEEKINLKQQMMDERKKAEQWMLDYAVQHIVTKLTPARKRRVAMLVEAFEAVVPLPEV